MTQHIWFHVLIWGHGTTYILVKGRDKLASKLHLLFRPFRLQTNLNITSWVFYGTSHELALSILVYIVRNFGVTHCTVICWLSSIYHKTSMYTFNKLCKCFCGLVPHVLVFAYITFPFLQKTKNRQSKTQIRMNFTQYLRGLIQLSRFVN